MWFSNKLYEHDKQSIYFIKIRDLKSKYPVIKSWNLNRPADEMRVMEIKKYFEDNKVTLIPGQICGWVNEINQLEIYDGWHRFSACNDTMYAYVKILHSNNHKDVINDFKLINMSISVPELYLKENTLLKKKVCENLATRLCEKFPDCRSTSRNPQPQNFNRDSFIEMIASLNINFELENVEIKIWTELLGLNKEAQAYTKTHNIKTPKKCQFTGFWLFFLNREFIKVKIEEAINRYAIS